MATIVKDIRVAASSAAAWDAIRDVGAPHTRLVPGFAVDARLEDGVRTVTFANGMTVREPIVTLDDDARRLVWTAQGGRTIHYNASLTVVADGDGTLVRWVADFLPDEMIGVIEAAMTAGAQAMLRALGGRH